MTQGGYRATQVKSVYVLIAFVYLLLIASCGGIGNNSTMNSGSNGGGTNTAPIPSVVIVTLENADYDSVVGSANAPYLNSLIAKGGLAANYYANIHPSIGDYFVLTTGEFVTLDDTFSGVVSIDNVVRELAAASRTWKVYAENLPSVGYLGGDVPPLYLRHHNPMTFFSDVQMDPTAQLNIVPYSQLSTDLSNAQLPAYSFIVPHAIDDAHTCNDGTLFCDLSQRIQNADTWLSNNLPSILNNTQFQQSGLLLITFDESADDLTNVGGRVMTLVLGTKVKPGYTGTAQYDHRSLLSLSMTALGATIPDDAGSAPQMNEFFQP